MEKVYYNVLEKIENNGFVSYIVGGYVRDFLLGKVSKDVDIITNATPKDLSKIFKNVKKTFEEYGAVKLYINDNIIDITTFRKELSYKNNKPVKIEYISSLEEDLKRRDFTINTLVMDKYGNIIDLLNGRKDLEDNVIRTVRDVKVEFMEDASRMLRSLRFMTSLNMKLDEDITTYIKENKDAFKSISINKRKEELDKIFVLSNANKFVDFIKDNNIDLGLEFNGFVSTGNTFASWAQVKVIDKYNFTKYEKSQIDEIKSLINKGNIDKIDIYEKGVYNSLLASQILGIDVKYINDLYNSLPIKSANEIDIDGNIICEIMNIKPGKKVGKLIEKIEKEILRGRIKNEKESIINYLREVK